METLGKLVVLLLICGASFWAGLSLSGRKEAEQARRDREQLQRYLAQEAEAARWREEARPAVPAPRVAGSAPKARGGQEKGHGGTPHGVPPEPTSVRLPCRPVPVTCEGPACPYDVRADEGACAHLRHGR